jgi:hypothetical protein
MIAPIIAYNASRRAVSSHPLRSAGTGTPADLGQPYHGTRGWLSTGQLPLARAGSGRQERLRRPIRWSLGAASGPSVLEEPPRPIPIPRPDEPPAGEAEAGSAGEQPAEE